MTTLVIPVEQKTASLRQVLNSCNYIATNNTVRLLCEAGELIINGEKITDPNTALPPGSYEVQTASLPFAFPLEIRFLTDEIAEELRGLRTVCNCEYCRSMRG